MSIKPTLVEEEGYSSATSRSERGLGSGGIFNFSRALTRASAEKCLASSFAYFVCSLAVSDFSARTLSFSAEFHEIRHGIRRFPLCCLSHDMSPNAVLRRAGHGPRRKRCAASPRRPRTRS